MEGFLSLLFIYMLFFGHFGRGLAKLAWGAVGVLAFSLAVAAYPVIGWLTGLLIGLLIIYAIGLLCYDAITGKTPPSPPPKPQIQPPPPANEEETTTKIILPPEVQKQLNAYYNHRSLKDNKKPL